MTATPKTDTAKTDTAKRQAAYRQRHLKEGTDQRLNLIIEAQAKLALQRLARHNAVSNKQMLETLLAQAQTQLLKTMGPEQQAVYLADFEPEAGQAAPKGSRGTALR